MSQTAVLQQIGYDNIRTALSLLSELRVMNRQYELLSHVAAGDLVFT